MRGYAIGKCEPCDALSLEEIDPDAPDQLLCKGCGATIPVLGPPGTALSGQIWRSGQSKRKGRLAKLRLAFTPQANRGGAIGLHERSICYHADHYSETVTICETGEVTHRCEEALSVHRGHGSAKVPKDPR
jgi:hypothetical protein